MEFETLKKNKWKMLNASRDKIIFISFSGKIKKKIETAMHACSAFTWHVIQATRRSN